MTDPLPSPEVAPTTQSAPPTDVHPTGTGRLESVALGPFDLESGVTLPELTVAYRHDGPGPADAPQVLVVHALTGSADAAGDWWAPLIGPGRALDTDRFGVLCANLLGGRYGTTGPTARDPRTGLQYGSTFPAVSTRDQARAQWRLLDALGIPELALTTGGSLGGMVALEVALERPAAVRHVLPMAAPAATGPLAIAWNHIQARLIDRLGDDGLALARELAMTTYRSEADFEERFGRDTEPDGRGSRSSAISSTRARSSSSASTAIRTGPSPARWIATTSAATAAASARRSPRWPRRGPESPASASKATSCTGRRRCGHWSPQRCRPA